MFRTPFGSTMARPRRCTIVYCVYSYTVLCIKYRLPCADRRKRATDGVVFNAFYCDSIVVRRLLCADRGNENGLNTDRSGFETTNNENGLKNAEFSGRYTRLD